MVNLQQMASRTVGLAMQLYKAGRVAESRALQHSHRAFCRATYAAAKPNRYALRNWDTVQQKIGLFPTPEIVATYNAHIALLMQYKDVVVLPWRNTTP